MKRIILTQKDHDLIFQLIRNSNSVDPVVKKCTKKLIEEMKIAEIREDDDVPEDVVRVRSTVTIKTPYGRKKDLQLVLPGQADIQRGKLSITSPMGMALVGYRKGDRVTWHFPKGDEIIYIEEVLNKKQTALENK